MSTILKALRRLEQDKAAETDQSLQVAVAQPAVAGAAAGRAPWLFGALAAAALGAGAVLLLQPRGDLAQPAVSAGPATSPAPAPVTATPPARVAPNIPESPPVAPPVVTEVAPPTEVAPAEAPLDLAPAAAPVAAVESAPPAPMPSPVAIEPLPAPAPLSEPPVVAEPPLIPEKPARVARVEPQVTAPRPALPGRAAASAEAGAVVAQAVTRGAADPSEGDDVRTAPPVHKRTARVAPASSGVTVLHTVWHPRAERRTALVESPGDALPKEYREGDRVGSLTVLRIEPSGVVFERDGVEIREKIGERP